MPMSRLTDAHVSINRGPCSDFLEPKAGNNIDPSPCFAVSLSPTGLARCSRVLMGSPAFAHNLADRTQSLASFQPGI